MRKHFACTYCGASGPGSAHRVTHETACIVPHALAAVATSSRAALVEAYFTVTVHRVMHAQLADSCPRGMGELV